MYVLANNVSSVELFVNGASKGKSSTRRWVHLQFPEHRLASGTIKAVGYDASGTQVCQHTLTTAGAAAAVKLTPTTASGGFLANGADVAMFDVEVVDANGERVPTYGPTTKQRTTHQLTSQDHFRRDRSGTGAAGSTKACSIRPTTSICTPRRNQSRLHSFANDCRRYHADCIQPQFDLSYAKVTSVAVNVVNGLL